MPVPYLGNAIKGWVKKKPVIIITKITANHLTQELETATTLEINIQPTPHARVMRMPAEQRTWKWWAIIIRQGPELKPDDVVVVNNKRYVIQSFGDWTESGFQKYDAIEDYQ